MSVAVRYYSRSGHTKALAEAIARGAGCEAQSTDTPLEEKTDLLFIGSGLYAASLDKHLKEFLGKIDSSMASSVVLFGTSAISKRALSLMRKELEAKGMNVLGSTFYAKSNPTKESLEAAEKFGRKVAAGA